MSYGKHPQYPTMYEVERERRYPYGFHRFLNPNPHIDDGRKVIEIGLLPREAKGISFWDYGLPPAPASASGTNSEVKGSGPPFYRERFTGPVLPDSKVVGFKVVPCTLAEVAKLLEEAEARKLNPSAAPPEMDYLERKYGGRHIPDPTCNGSVFHFDRNRGPPPPDMKVASFEILCPNDPEEFDPFAEEEDEDEEVLVEKWDPATDTVADSSAATSAAVSAAASGNKAEVGDPVAQMSEEVRVLKRPREDPIGSRETAVENPNPAAKSPAATAAASVAQMPEEESPLKRLHEDLNG